MGTGTPSRLRRIFYNLFKWVFQKKCRVFCFMKYLLINKKYYVKNCEINGIRFNKDC
jgi:hypothetical protein